MSLEEEAKELLFFFARFEYALKARGYIAAYSSGGAKVNWDSFKKEANFPIPDDEDVSYLTQHPPKQQFYRDGKIEWVETELDLTIPAGLIEAAKTIRNNLVHGGKMNDPNDERNLKLIRAARKILEAALSADENLRTYFAQARIQIN